MKLTYLAKNETYIVVGANSGIGKALIEILLLAEAQVIGIDISESSNTHHNFSFFKANPLDAHSLEYVKKSLSTQDINYKGLICLSGTISHFGSVMDLSPEQWREVYDISFTSCYNACKVFVPLLQSASKSSIVHMSSGLAFGGQANYGPYTNAKASVISLSKTLATELAPNIRVNTIAPGAVDTAFIKKDDGTTRFNIEDYKNIVPLGQMAKPTEIADLIMYLLSDGSSHITGQCIHINGGAMMI